MWSIILSCKQYLTLFSNELATLIYRRYICNIINSICVFFLQKVDYRAIGESAEFKQYVKHTAELKRVNVTNASREEKTAFFINVYNALVIHAFVERGPPSNLWQRYKVGLRSLVLFSDSFIESGYFLNCVGLVCITLTKVGIAEWLAFEPCLKSPRP